MAKKQTARLLEGAERFFVRTGHSVEELNQLNVIHVAGTKGKVGQFSLGAGPRGAGGLELGGWVDCLSHFEENTWAIIHVHNLVVIFPK